MDQKAAQEFFASEAYHAGRRAGRSGFAPSLNPHAPDTFEAAQWLRGHNNAVAEQLIDANRRIPPCRFGRDIRCPATCGGRGHCADIA